MKNQKSTYSEPQFWQAFQFVAGELSAEQSEAFELQMLESAALCEALSDAVRLSAAVASGNRKPWNSAESRDSESCDSESCDSELSRTTMLRRESVSPQHSTFRKSAVALVATVCCCLLVLLVVSSDSNSEFAMADGKDGTSEAELLVSAWASGFSDEVVEVEDAVDDAETDLQDLNVPDWMLTAVSLTDDVDGNL